MCCQLGKPLVITTFSYSLLRSFYFIAMQIPKDNATQYVRIGVFQLTMLKSLRSCCFKPTLNSYNFTSLLSAWILFLGFFNIAVKLGLTICGLLRLSSCFSALRFSWITPSKIITICLLLILASHGELFFGNLIQLSFICSSDIKINPGPKTKNQISFCHWNLNGLAAHNFTKCFLLQVLSVTHHYDFICLSETFLDSYISNDNERINIKGYNLLRADHPSNKIEGGVCMYYEEHLPIIKRDDLCTLKECLVTEIIVVKKPGFFYVFV